MPEQEIVGFDADPEGPAEHLPVRVRDREFSLVRLQQDMHLAHQLTEAALGLTTARDWTYFGKEGEEKPWLCRSGAERVRRSLGISVEIIVDPDTKRPYTMYKDSDEKGSFMCVEMMARVTHPALGQIEVMGFASTRDRFFGQAGSEADGTPIWKPLSEVNQGHVKMKCFTNLFVNAITRFTGISNIDPAELRSRFGDKVQKVGFRSKTETRTAEQVSGDSALAKELWAICMAASGGSEPNARALLADVSAFTLVDGPEKGKKVPGVTDVNKMKGGRLFNTVKRARERWEEFLAKNPTSAEKLKADLAKEMGA